MKLPKAVIWLSALIAVLVLVAAATGVFYQTPGAHISFVTVRGEHPTYQGSGLYRYDPASVAREGVIWDVIDLCLALPLFVLAIVLSQRNALRGRLGLCGMLFTLLCLVGLYVAWRFFWSVWEEEQTRAHGEIAPV